MNGDGQNLVRVLMSWSRDIALASCCFVYPQSSNTRPSTIKVTDITIGANLRQRGEGLEPEQGILQGHESEM